VLPGLPAALAAAFCFGVATVLQALGVRTTDGSAAPDGGLAGTVRAMGSRLFVAGLAMDGAGFLAQLIALRSLPLYVVQAALAGALAVTAVTGALLLGMRLGRAEWLGVAGVCGGLALLGATAGAEGHRQPGMPFHWVLAAAVVVLAAVGGAARRLGEPARAGVLGVLCGFGFGLVGLAVRVLPAVHGMDVLPLLTDPAAYALLGAGAAAFLFLTEALRGGSVTTATAGMVLGETGVPALLGVLLLGDGTRPGLVPVAAAGFALAVAGALTLARFGEIGDGEGAGPGAPVPETQAPGAQSSETH
jgi:drug/metabolite transporter (DMT)-like permease